MDERREPRRSVAEVPAEHRAQDVRWLVLEHDPGTGGWFLFLHGSLEEGSLFDSWHLRRAEALEAAEDDWGVGPELWQLEEG